MNKYENRPGIYIVSVIAVSAVVMSSAGFAAGTAAEGFADFITEDSGVAGGVAVTLGTETSDVAVALSKRGSFVVHALHGDEDAVRQARQAIRSTGMYGRVSARITDPSRLPYVERFVSLLIVDNYPQLKQKGLSADEIGRVVSPLGYVYLGNTDTAQAASENWAEAAQGQLEEAGFEAEIKSVDGQTWIRARKPWPDNIDEWQHHRHGADGNPVAEDELIGPSKHYQWTSGPLWFRSHDTDSSIAAIVSANGRIFYLEDKAPLSVAGNHPLPDKWYLVARDAFNGALLWEVPLKRWGWKEWKKSWFSPRPGNIPLGLDERIVAIDDRVYFTLGYHAPVSQLNAKTGEVIQTYEGTEEAREILHLNGNLFITVDTGPKLKVMKIDAGSGETLWESENRYNGITSDYIRWASMRGAIPRAELDPILNPAANENIVSVLDGMDVVGIDAKTGKQLWRTSASSKKKTLWVGTNIVYENVVLHASARELVAFDADTGEQLWTKPKKTIGHLWFEWKDVFVIDGLVWTWSAEFESTKYKRGNQSRRSQWPAYVNGYDPHTGETKKQVPLSNIMKAPHHHRCYRNKATPQYIIASRRGAEFIDVDTGVHDVNNWVHGACHYGMMPANGLLYVPTHGCVCYLREKLNGFNALAGSIPQKYRRDSEAPGPELQRGPAFGKSLGDAADEDDWPAYRHDSMRTGSTPAEMPESVKQAWKVDIGGRLSPPIVADDKLFVSQIDSHHILAFDAATGEKLWEFAAGARVDSPPTYYDGMLLFGCTDGWTYCLRASDGTVVWKFRGAPEERMMGSWGQIESVWPVHGSVLVQDGIAYIAAGRSSHLDGGIYMYAVNATTGKQIHSQHLQGPDRPFEEFEQNIRPPQGYLTDIMKGDGEYIYMYYYRYTQELQKAGGHNPGVVARGGFLDDTYFRRAAWYLDRGGNYGRVIVHNDDSAYYVRMWKTRRNLDPENYFTPGKDNYRLFAQDLNNNYKERWSHKVPVRVRAMVAAPNVLYAAGPPDVIDPDDPLGAFEGRLGAKFMTVEADSGDMLQNFDLASPPVFNGMAAADGRLYICTRDGHLMCMSG